MRIWDLPTSTLCRKHLLAEHRELHAIWNIIALHKTGYANHPETKRWRGKLKALYIRHQQQVAEMKKRGYNHASELDPDLARGPARQNQLLETKTRQIQMLTAKNCECPLE